MPPFTLPNDPSMAVGAGAYSGQTQPDKGDIDIIVASIQGTGVQSGCLVTPNSSGVNTNVNVSAGQISILGVQVTVNAVTNLTVAAGGASDRVDLITVNSVGAVAVLAGTAAALPTYAAVATDGSSNLARAVLAAVWVPASATSITASNITSKAIPPVIQGFAAPNLGGLNVYGHSWLAGGFPIAGQNSPEIDIVGHLMAMLGVDEQNMNCFGANGAKLTGSGGSVFLNGIKNCSWATVLQTLYPPASTQWMKASQNASTNNVSDHPSFFLWGVNDSTDDPWGWIQLNASSVQLGINAWASALRTICSRAMSGAVYLAVQGDGTADSTIALGTGGGSAWANVLGTDQNSGAGVAQVTNAASSLNGHTVTVTIPSDYQGGTSAALCFIGQAGGAATVDTAGFTSAAGQVIPIASSRSDANCVTTINSTNLTSSSAAFTARDVGRVIAGSGLPLTTTIASVTNGTTVVLSTAATASATVTCTIGTNPVGNSMFPTATGTFVAQVDTEEILVTITAGPVYTATTRGVNGTSAAAHSQGAVITVANDTVKVNFTGTASSASGSLFLNGQGQAMTPVPVVKRFALTTADAGKTIIATVAGTVSGDTSSLVSFDSWWLEAATAAPVMVANTPRFPYALNNSGHSNNDIANVWAPMNTSTTSVVGEFPANVFVVDVDSLFYSQSMTVNTDITAAATSFVVNLQGTVAPVVGDFVHVDGETMLVTAVSGTGPYTLTVTRGVSGAATGHKTGQWVGNNNLLSLSDSLHPSTLGAAKVSRKTAQTLVTTLPSLSGDVPAVSGAKFHRNHDSVAMGLVDLSYIAPIAAAYNAVTTLINNLTAVPIYIPERCIVTAIGAYVVTGQSSTVLRMGIYMPDLTGGRPGDLLLDAGSVASTSNSVWTEVTGLWQLLEPGYYWLASVSQGGTTQPTCTCVAGITFPAMQFFYSTGTTPIGTGLHGILGSTTVTGALPTSWGSVFSVVGFGTAPRVAVKVRAHHYG